MNKFKTLFDRFSPRLAAHRQGLAAPPDAQPKFVHKAADLDPFSDAYFDAQMQLYEEIAGTSYDAPSSEMSHFDGAGLIEAANPMGLRNVSGVVLHHVRLGHMLRAAELPDAPEILDMGAGWGTSSEFFATLGANVTAVDINPRLVDLIRQRQERSGLPIRAHEGTFEDYVPDRSYDAVVFYECLHHAVRPWDVIARMRKALKLDGRILFAGEPVNGIWWRHWGMRLDALSVYCIRKFGWFESGCSEDFIRTCFIRAGFRPRYRVIPGQDIGGICVATSISGDDQRFGPVELKTMTGPSEWDDEGAFLTSLGRGALFVPRIEGLRAVTLDVVNNRLQFLRLIVSGPSGIEVPISDASGWNAALQIDSELWCPASELGSAYPRKIGVALHAMGLLVDT